MAELLIIAFGLMLVIEGALYALFPDMMRRMLAAALMQPVEKLRIMGAAAVAIGVLVVWFVKVIGI